MWRAPTRGVRGPGAREGGTAGSAAGRPGARGLGRRSPGPGRLGHAGGDGHRRMRSRRTASAGRGVREEEPGRHWGDGCGCWNGCGGSSGFGCPGGASCPGGAGRAARIVQRAGSGVRLLRSGPASGGGARAGGTVGSGAATGTVRSPASRAQRDPANRPPGRPKAAGRCCGQPAVRGGGRRHRRPARGGPAQGAVARAGAAPGGGDGGGDRAGGPACAQAAGAGSTAVVRVDHGARPGGHPHGCGRCPHPGADTGAAARQDGRGHRADAHGVAAAAAFHAVADAGGIDAPRR